MQNLIALRPPTDPATGEMVYDTPQAAQYRDALQDIVARYGGIEDFKEAARLPDPTAVPGPELASTASPGPPNFTAAPSAEASLAQFAQSMMALGPLPGAGGTAQNALPALVPRRGTGTIG